MISLLKVQKTFQLNIFLLLIWNSSLCDGIGENRKQIETITSGILPLRITTGSGNASKMNFKKLYIESSSHKGDRFVVSKETRRLVKHYRDIKNVLIADLANQDPKIFKPDDSRYWNIASKRGFFFNIASIICMVINIILIFV